MLPVSVLNPESSKISCEFRKLLEWFQPSRDINLIVFIIPNVFEEFLKDYVSQICTRNAKQVKEASESYLHNIAVSRWRKTVVLFALIINNQKD